MSYATNHPLAIMYALLDRGELGLPHYHVIQSATNLKQAIQHIQLKTTLGALLLSNLKLTQLYTGHQTGILTDTSSNINYVKSNWWTSVWKFLKFAQANLHMEIQYMNPPFREDHYGIMELSKRQQYWTTLQLQKNQCMQTSHSGHVHNRNCS